MYALIIGEKQMRISCIPIKDISLPSQGRRAAAAQEAVTAQSRAEQWAGSRPQPQGSRIWGMQCSDTCPGAACSSHPFSQKQHCCSAMAACRANASQALSLHVKNQSEPTRRVSPSTETPRGHSHHTQLCSHGQGWGGQGLRKAAQQRGWGQTPLRGCLNSTKICGHPSSLTSIFS